MLTCLGFACAARAASCRLDRGAFLGCSFGVAMTDLGSVFSAGASAALVWTAMILSVARVCIAWQISVLLVPSNSAEFNFTDN